MQKIYLGMILFCCLLQPLNAMDSTKNINNKQFALNTATVTVLQYTLACPHCPTTKTTIFSNIEKQDRVKSRYKDHFIKCHQKAVIKNDLYASRRNWCEEWGRVEPTQKKVLIPRNQYTCTCTFCGTYATSFVSGTAALYSVKNHICKNNNSKKVSSPIASLSTKTNPENNHKLPQPKTFVSEDIDELFSIESDSVSMQEWKDMEIEENTTLTAEEVVNNILSDLDDQPKIEEIEFF